MKRFLVLAAACVLMAAASPAMAYKVMSEEAIEDREAPRQIDALKETVALAVQRLDGEALLPHLHPQVVVVQPDGTTLEGPEAVKRYLAACKAGTGGWLRGASMKPEIKTSAIEGKTALVSGLAHDQYTLTDGSTMALESRFTAVLERSAGVWQIRQLQAAPAGFDNPMMMAVVNKSANALVWVWVFGAAAGAFVSMLVTRHFMKKKAA